MKTLSANNAEVQRAWHIVDATDLVLGRISTRVASILRGKHKPTYTPHVDTGDFVVVINADKVKLTGKKETAKTYYHHTQYPGGIIGTTVKSTREKHPERLVVHSVKGMLPRGPLGRKMLKKLKVYAGAEHPHSAQQPIELKI